MQNTLSLVTSAALALAFLVTPAALFAQTEQQGSAQARTRSSGYEVTSSDGSSYAVGFEDDLMTALVNDGHVPSIKVRPIPGRTYLLRPRTHFVPELVKSVEWL